MTEDHAPTATDAQLTADRREEITAAVRSVRPSAPVQQDADATLRATVTHRQKDALADALGDVDAYVDHFDTHTGLGTTAVVAVIGCRRRDEAIAARAESKAMAEAEARAERTRERRAGRHLRGGR